ncbi:sugar porter family MFS transporter [Candidatus Nephthysia bennettiae]|uniref:Sugar porter family MFS transporter n=1 Tax=Candidatus Nephthysia bennettiae TaxID=3127016 RepID=A0A934N9L0_9BACT|nr:sugar porter family MFS transporter [Candidatus Dormibacteraeota bacterium]MBJ7610687.1 sugar porter family MFS transporter [Candidatus Dormibacteraeota bacterium]
MSERGPSRGARPGASVPATAETAANTGRVVMIASVAAIAGFLFGFDTAVINGAVAAVASNFNEGAVRLGLSVSAALLGAALGAMVAGRLADRFGRVPTMVMAAVTFLIQSFGVAFSFTVYDFTFWRIVGGIAVGAASVIAPAYIAEVAPAGLRGRLGSLQQLAIVVGIFIALLVDFAIAAAAGGATKTWLFGLPAWRWMFLSEVVPSIIYLVGALRIPESPRYLVAVNKLDEAREVLLSVMGTVRLDAKIGEIRQSLRTERKPRFSDITGGRYGLLPIVWIGIGLSVFQQFVGINVIFYYSSVLWQAVGFTEKQSLLITVIGGAVNIVTTLIAIGTIDRFGRKPLLLVGSAGMILTLGTMSFLFGSAPLVGGLPRLQGANGTIALFAANLYVFFFGMSWGPVVWVLLGEMFPNRIRAAALGVAAAMQWIANFVVSTTFPTLKNIGLGYAYGLYALAAVLSFVFVLAFIRETRGRELEAMSEMMGRDEVRKETAQPSP